MSNNNRLPSRLSYVGRHPDLQSGTPISLRNTNSNHSEFNGEADPLFKRQRQDLKLSEKERRDQQGEGSQMIKLHKPFPQLKPKNNQQPLRDTFNHDWMKERQRAVMAHLEQQERHKLQLQNEQQYQSDRGYEYL